MNETFWRERLTGSPAHEDGGPRRRARRHRAGAGTMLRRRVGVGGSGLLVAAVVLGGGLALGAGGSGPAGPAPRGRDRPRRRPSTSPRSRSCPRRRRRPAPADACPACRTRGSAPLAADRRANGRRALAVPRRGDTSCSATVRTCSTRAVPTWTTPARRAGGRLTRRSTASRSASSWLDRPGRARAGDGAGRGEHPGRRRRGRCCEQRRALAPADRAGRRRHVQGGRRGAGSFVVVHRQADGDRVLVLVDPLFGNNSRVPVADLGVTKQDVYRLVQDDRLDLPG